MGLMDSKFFKAKSIGEYRALRQEGKQEMQITYDMIRRATVLQQKANAYSKDTAALMNLIRRINVSLKKKARLESVRQLSSARLELLRERKDWVKVQELMKQMFNLSKEIIAKQNQLFDEAKTVYGITQKEARQMQGVVRKGQALGLRKI